MKWEDAFAGNETPLTTIDHLRASWRLDMNAYIC